jgi:hypothetical protein
MRARRLAGLEEDANSRLVRTAAPGKVHSHVEVDLERGGELERGRVCVTRRLEHHQAPADDLIALFLLEDV